MKKIFLGIVFLLCTISFSQFFAVSSCESKKISQSVLDRQAVRQCASFLVSKKIIRNVGGYLHRSINPTKKLLQNVFYHCDFHRYQLEQLKQYVSEAEVLIHESAPIIVRTVLFSLQQAQIKEFIDQLGCEDSDNDEIEQPLFDYVDNIESYLAEKNPELYTSLVEQYLKWQEFNDKWQEPISLLADYVSTRLKVRQEYIENNIEVFKRAMIWQHIGPTLGLGIEAAWTARNLFGCHSIDDIIVSLIQEMYGQLVDKKDILEEEMISLARKTIRSYGIMCHQIINKSLSRTI